VELARERAKPVREIAEDLGIAESCLRRWIAADDVEAGRKEGVTKDERKEPGCAGRIGSSRWRRRSWEKRP
jgi:predicted transcriptional regulator